MATRRSARLQGIAPPTLEDIINSNKRDIDDITRIGQLHDTMASENQEDERLDHWRDSMKTFLEEQTQANEERRAQERHARNPLAFDLNFKFLDAGGIADQYIFGQGHSFVHGRFYHKFTIHCTKHGLCSCEPVAKKYHFILCELPEEALSLPWLKPWSVEGVCPKHGRDFQLDYQVTGYKSVRFHGQNMYDGEVRLI
jgi:hypothetical protein